MKGKLIKMVEGYTLSLTGDIDDLYAISNHQLAVDHQLYKLSTKNCDDIANGYDLQQTEWDVEIEMNSWFKNGYDGKIVDTHPKLDTNGCLILKI